MEMPGLVSRTGVRKSCHIAGESPRPVSTAATNRA